jgi:hypothetical protein
MEGRGQNLALYVPYRISRRRGLFNALHSSLPIIANAFLLSSGLFTAFSKLLQHLNSYLSISQIQTRLAQLFLLLGKPLEEPPFP